MDIAKEKARPAVALRRPTKVLQDGIAQGGVNLRFLSTGFSVLEGGIPIVRTRLREPGPYRAGTGL